MKKILIVLSILFLLPFSVFAEENLIEEPQIEEPQIEEPQIEEPQIEEPQIEEPQMSSSVITNDYISIDFGVSGYPDSETILCEWDENCVCTNLPDSDYTILSFLSVLEFDGMTCSSDLTPFPLSSFTYNVYANIFNSTFTGPVALQQESQTYCETKLTAPVCSSSTTMVQYLPYDLRIFGENTNKINASNTANFWLEKKIDYGDILIIFFLTFFFCALIFKLLWNFNWKDEKAKL